MAYISASFFFAASRAFLLMTSAKLELSTLNFPLEHFILNHHLKRSSTTSPSQKTVPYHWQSRQQNVTSTWHLTYQGSRDKPCPAEWRRAGCKEGGWPWLRSRRFICWLLYFTLNFAWTTFLFWKFCLLNVAVESKKYFLTFSRPGVSANQRIALAHTLPRLGLDLPVRADLDQLGPDLLDDTPVTNLFSLEFAVLPTKFNHADRQCVSHALKLFLKFPAKSEWWLFRRYYHSM